MFRVAAVGHVHETNTFSAEPASLDLYRSEAFLLHQEAALFGTTSATSFAGFLGERDDGLSVEALFYATQKPRGATTAVAHAAIASAMTTALVEAGHFDGVLLDLHGAAVAEDAPSLDAALAEAVRATVGPEKPIFGVLDMHANVCASLVRAVDALVPYQTNPHVDTFERGRRCRELLAATLHSGRKPLMAWRPLPLVVNIVKQDTAEPPMADLLAAGRELAEHHGLWDLSILEGFPYADVAHMGMSIIAVHPTDRHVAQKAADELADLVWARRHDLQGTATSHADAVTIVSGRDAAAGPLLLLDVGDNIGGGAGGDSTELLERFVRASTPGVLCFMTDAEAVAAVAGVEPGTPVVVTVGSGLRQQPGPPVNLRGRLLARSDGRFREPVVAHGGARDFNSGPTVAIETEAGVTVVVGSVPVQTISPVQALHLGVDPAAFRAVVAKGVNAPRAGYARITTDVCNVDTPGVTRLSITELDYQHRPRPMFPYEPATTFDHT